MKKLLTVLMIVLTVLHGVMPAAVALAAAFEYWVFFESPIYPLLVLLVTGAAVALSFRKLPAEGKLWILAAILGLLAAVNCWLCWGRMDAWLYKRAMLISLAGAVCLMMKLGRAGWLRRICAGGIILAVLLLLLLEFLRFALPFGKDTLVRTLDSPDGSRIAQVVINDQGAMGGNTYVEVRQKPVKLLLFSLKKEPERLYTDSWSEGEQMQVAWKDDHCLIINGREYPVK